MDIDLTTECGPTEETIEALMEYLVCPLLPLKHNDIAKDTPSESQQKSVAKQVHAAAVLYNYYHLNQNREREFLKFDQFCNLAIMFKPSILQHMRYMTQSNRPTINDPENQLSLTEKAVMDACAISETLLDASTNISNVIKEWPITKVAVLLIDSKKENCFLQFNNGVWSVIERDLYCEENGIGNESKKGKKRKLSLMRKYDESEDVLQEAAFSAVKEVAGIKGELKVLEGHVVYSLSQAKTATQFYIVQSNQSISEDKLVPIQDAIPSLQGPVVMKSSGSWVITPVVEYYYLLPYAEVICKCFSRSNGFLTDQMKEGTANTNIIQGSKKSFKKEGDQSKQVSSDHLQINKSNLESKTSSDNLQVNKSKLESKTSSDNLQTKSKLESKSVHISNSNKEPLEDKVSKSRNISKKDAPTLQPVDNVLDEVIETKTSLGKRAVDADNDNKKQKDMNGSCSVEPKDSLSEGNCKGINKPLVCLQKESQSSKLHTPLKVYHHEKRTTTNAVSIKEDLKVLKNMPIINECKANKGEKKVDEDKSRMITLDRGVAKSEPLEDFHMIMDAKRSQLSQAALRSLLNKRQKLSNQQRNIEDELILCEKKIHAIMQGGIGDCLGLKLEAVIDCCNEICQQDNMQIQDLKLCRSLPLSEAQLSLRKACEELDDICLSNNWMLPTYHMSRSDGGIVANVSVKGIDFECFGVSGMQQSIREARNSAAVHVITKLQQMAQNHNNTLV